MVDADMSPWYWPANTVIQLCSVPWDAEYRSVVSWDSDAHASATDYRDAWFDERGQQLRISNASYMRYNEPIRVPLHVNAAMSYNYVRVRNHQPGDQLRWYFYFITDVHYVSPNTTQLQLQLDVWQTFYQHCSWGRAWVERGHVGIADFKSNVDYYSSFGQALCALPEGLDTGSSMRVTNHDAWSLISNEPGVMVTSSINLFSEPFDTTGVAYAAGSTPPKAPRVLGTSGTHFELGLDSTENYFFETADDLRSTLGALYEAPWVVQGIQSITAVPSHVIDHIKSTGTKVPMTSSVFAGRSINCWTAGYSGTTKSKTEVKRIPNFRSKFSIPDRYQHLKKLQCWPYAAIELTTFSGQSVILQPELVWHHDLILTEMSTYNPTRPRVAVYAAGYNGQGAAEIDMTNGPSDGSKIDGGEFLNHAVVIDDFPRFAVSTSSGLMYMAQNARSLSQQQQAASWSQSKAQTSAQLSYDQSTNQVGAAQQQQNASISAQQQQTALSNMYTGIQGATGTIQSLGNLDVGSAAMSAANAALAISQANQSTAIDVNRQAIQNQASNSAALYMRDTNRSYANWASQGDYQQTIAAINARVQDAQVAAPAMHGASGGNHLNTLHRVLGVAIRWKQIPRAQLAVVGEYLLTYGYFVQLWCTPPANLHCMSIFSYWKLRDSHVFGDGVPELARMTIRGILEKGVTVWRNPDSIGVADPGDNEPVVDNYLNVRGPGEDGW